ncbi:MAG: Hsp70 family protein [Planctomycetaceae bacterium]
MDHSDGPIVGIDLGTTNSVVAAVVNGQAQVLDESGETILPSVVAVNTDGQLITGFAARNQLAAFPDRTIASIKRRMGSMEAVSLGSQTFTPPEISAMILRRLRDRASRALQQPVTRAVITVPAFFDENQRQATREAGELAGLKVERIINEPTAATLVYHAGSHDRKQILVYDFGGGTFDVSVVRMEAGVIEVLSSRGDTHLGGDDLDQLLLDEAAGRFQDEHQIDLREDASTRYRLLRACEEAKIHLSREESAQIIEEFIADKGGQPLNLAMTVSRDEFEELISPLVDRTIASVDEALRDARLTIHQIDDLVLVGGSTRIPLVQRRLREEFLREPSRAVDPDLAVALGAAVQAAMIDGLSVGPVLVDVTGHTLGIEACVGISFAGPQLVFSPIIHRNSPLPARYEQAYSTMHDEQEQAEIHVLQGEHADVHRNRSIGRFMLDLEQGGGDRSKIVVRFDLTLDGTLDVTATQPATGVSKALRIDNALSQFQADQRDRAQARLGAMFDASQELISDADWPSLRQWESREKHELPASGRLGGDGLAAAASRFPAALDLLKRAEEIKSSVAGDDAEEIEMLCESLYEAIADNDPTAIATLSAELDDVLFYVR